MSQQNSTNSLKLSEQHPEICTGDESSPCANNHGIILTLPNICGTGYTCVSSHRIGSSSSSLEDPKTYRPNNSLTSKSVTTYNANSELKSLPSSTKQILVPIKNNKKDKYSDKSVTSFVNINLGKNEVQKSRPSSKQLKRPEHPIVGFLEDHAEFLSDNFDGREERGRSTPSVLESTVDGTIVKGARRSYGSRISSNDLNFFINTSSNSDQDPLIALDKCGLKTERHKYQCSACTFKSVNRVCVEQHVESEGFDHRGAVVVVLLGEHARGRNCPICHMKLQGRHIFKHIRCCHGSRFPLRCGYCVFLGQDYNQMRHHIKKKHDTSEYKIIDIPRILADIECSDEEGQESQEEEFYPDGEGNRDSLTPTRQFVCPVCKVSLKTLSNLKKHLVKHSRQKLQCDLCQFTTSLPTQIRRHYRCKHPTHTPHWHKTEAEDRVNGALVEDVTPYLQLIAAKYGIRQPNKDTKWIRQYRCPHCDYTCSYNSSYNRHLRLHNGIKPYKCGHCDFHGREAYIVRNHCVKVHEDKEPVVEGGKSLKAPYRFATRKRRVWRDVEAVDVENNPGELYKSNATTSNIPQKTVQENINNESVTIKLSSNNILDKNINNEPMTKKLPSVDGSNIKLETLVGPGISNQVKFTIPVDPYFGISSFKDGTLITETSNNDTKNCLILQETLLPVAGVCLSNLDLDNVDKNQTLAAEGKQKPNAEDEEAHELRNSETEAPIPNSFSSLVRLYCSNEHEECKSPNSPSKFLKHTIASPGNSNIKDRVIENRASIDNYNENSNCRLHSKSKKTTDEPNYEMEEFSNSNQDISCQIFLSEYDLDSQGYDMVIELVNSNSEAIPVPVQMHKRACLRESESNFDNNIVKGINMDSSNNETPHLPVELRNRACVRESQLNLENNIIERINFSKLEHEQNHLEILESSSSDDNYGKGYQHKSATMETMENKMSILEAKKREACKNKIQRAEAIRLNQIKREEAEEKDTCQVRIQDDSHNCRAEASFSKNVGDMLSEHETKENCIRSTEDALADNVILKRSDCNEKIQQSTQDSVEQTIGESSTKAQSATTASKRVNVVSDEDKESDGENPTKTPFAPTASKTVYISSDGATGLENNLHTHIAFLSDSREQQVKTTVSATPGVRTRDLLHLDYTNNDYFSSERVRSMMMKTKSGQVTCKECGVTTTYRAFYKHAKKHFNIKPFKCGYCSYRSVEKSKIRVHNTFCHSNNPCIIHKLSPEDAKIETTPTNIRNMEIIKAESDIKMTATYLNKNTVTGKKICNAEFKQSDNSDKLSCLLNTNNSPSQIIHEPSEISNCRTDNIIDKHVKVKFSSSPKPVLYQCPKCFKFLQKHTPSIRRHLYRHFKYKPYKCGYCSFTGLGQSEVRAHHVTHGSGIAAKVEPTGNPIPDQLTELLDTLTHHRPPPPPLPHHHTRKEHTTQHTSPHTQVFDKEDDPAWKTLQSAAHNDLTAIYLTPQTQSEHSLLSVNEQNSLESSIANSCSVSHPVQSEDLATETAYAVQALESDGLNSNCLPSHLNFSMVTDSDDTTEAVCVVYLIN